MTTNRRSGHQHGADLGGIRTLERLRERCRIDEETGCWHWGLAISQGSPTVCLIHPETGVRLKMRGRRAALVLHLGKELPKGHSTYAAACCTSFDCVNPAHCRHGSRVQVGAAHAKSGLLKGDHRRTLVNRANMEARRRLSAQQVQTIRAGGKSDVAFAKEFGVSAYAVWAAKKGHTHKHIPLVATSVFAWRPV